MKYGFKWGMTAVAATFFLAACGGGNSDDSDDTPTVEKPVASFTYSPAEPVVGGQVKLDASASTAAEGRTLSYSWNLTGQGCNQVSLAGVNEPNPSFIPVRAGACTVGLTVVDDQQTISEEFKQTLTVKPDNVAPVAHAGNMQEVSVGTTVILDGTASSDADGDTLSHRWNLYPPTGSSAKLDNATKARPQFTADVAGNYTATLTVSDGKLDSTPASVTVKAHAVEENTPPVANAGKPQSVRTGQQVTLDGSASTDADGDSLTYQWAFAQANGKPNGSNASLNGADTAKPTFTADQSGSYTIELTVNDGKAASEKASVTVNASAENAAPTAAIAGGNRAVSVGDLVVLEGSGSDPEGTPLSYQWTLASKPQDSTASLGGANSEKPSFTADKEGDYVISLIVSDGSKQSEPVNVTITAQKADTEQVLALYIYEDGAWKQAPYDVRGVGRSITLPEGQTTAEIARFKLVAGQSAVTLSNFVNRVSQTDHRDEINPRFDGIGEGFVLQPGSEQEFRLLANKVAGENPLLRYDFSITEAGQASILFRYMGNFTLN